MTHCDGDEYYSADIWECHPLPSLVLGLGMSLAQSRATRPSGRGRPQCQLMGRARVPRSGREPHLTACKPMTCGPRDDTGGSRGPKTPRHGVLQQLFSLQAMSRDLAQGAQYNTQYVLRIIASIFYCTLFDPHITHNYRDNYALI